MMDSTTAEYIFVSVVVALDRVGVDWSRAVSVATDGAPSMIGKKSGGVTKIKAKVQVHNGGVRFWAFQCIENGPRYGVGCSNCKFYLSQRAIPSSVFLSLSLLILLGVLTVSGYPNQHQHKRRVAQRYTPTHPFGRIQQFHNGVVDFRDEDDSPHVHERIDSLDQLLSKINHLSRDDSDILSEDIPGFSRFTLNDVIQPESSFATLN
ncbi:unnamed protein product [Lepeophtheirus salmonis]|uniref:(salmon louse) hypothetical protein n=1 Tax=Lepeophtheirus salmonis TaxID=72036 RepID=A0A7R8D3D5_LEPSM|nr:unnamed protein product [Lepeophtheirus salmonis]CAF2982331.1 unnamed protein product [Lepeophtheirus salmonis]